MAAIFRPEILGWIGLGSAIMFVLTLVALPPIIAYLPADYFVRSRSPAKIGIANWALLIAKNIFGWLILLVGISMLVLPGQGVMTILVGLMLINFPGKRRTERWLVARPRVLSSLNWIREKAGREPLVIETVK